MIKREYNGVKGIRLLLDTNEQKNILPSLTQPFPSIYQNILLNNKIFSYFCKNGSQRLSGANGNALQISRKHSIV